LVVFRKQRGGLKSAVVRDIVPFSLVWRHTSPPSAGSKNKSSNQSSVCCLLASCWLLVWFTFWPWRSRWDIPMKHWLTFHWTAWCYVSEDGALHSHHCEGLESNREVDWCHFCIVVWYVPLANTWSTCESMHIVLLWFLMHMRPHLAERLCKMIPCTHFTCFTVGDKPMFTCRIFVKSEIYGSFISLQILIEHT
jgi:hypothetical protein